MARKVVIPPLGEVRLRHFTARNTRRGGGGEIDFIAYSPKGILWTDDLNKNQIICLHSDPSKLIPLPLPVGFPQFTNQTQDVSLWNNYCAAGRCWNEVLHYQQFATDVNVGSDSETGGYVMAKVNSSKTCDAFVDQPCIDSKGGDTCMQNVINTFLANLPPADPAVVTTDRQLFAAICAQNPLIWLAADLDLREEHWPANCTAPVRLVRNMTISGPLDQPIKYTINFNFMARKVVIPPLGEVRLRHFTARNTRRGGGGEIDFIAYSPKGILWTDDLNKNQIICLHSDPSKLIPLPLPVGFPQFTNQTQDVSLWNNYCAAGRCWIEVLHYQQFATDVNVGSDSETGGYVMAKVNSSKTCDAFVDQPCIESKGGDTCMQNVINTFLANLPPADPAVVTTDRQLFAAICAQNPLIWLAADLDLREEHWPANCTAPVRLVRNMTISGPLDQPIKYTINFNFMARKVVIPPLGEVRLRHFTARNTRRGGGGEIDFIAYSPKGILWTDDLNKNQIICLHSDPSKLIPLPLPVGFPQFTNQTQDVSLWNNYCAAGRCWNEVLHYQQFATDVNVGSDSETGGYVMAKVNSSKTCDAFVDQPCIDSKGGDTCMQDVINTFLANLPPADNGTTVSNTSTDSGDSSVNVLAIALPVALGGAALIAIIAAVTVWAVRKRRRAAAAEAAAAAKLADLESGGAGYGRNHDGRGLKKGSKGGDSQSSDSKEHHNSEEENAMGVYVPRHNNAHGHERPHDTLASSFRYETGDDMGRCLVVNAAAVGAAAGSGAGSLAAGSAGGMAVVEGVMDDGSVCALTVGAALGQGSYGVVFRGTWRERPVAVKVICCERQHAEQVSTEVKLMMSDTCRHPHLLRALACMSRTRIVNSKINQVAAALEATLSTLARTRGSGGGPGGSQQMAGSGSDSYRDSGANAGELVETWIVSEYCDLGALAPHVHIAKKFLAPPRPGSGERRPMLAPILSCLHDIAAGMAHLHALNVVHGDLKLANVLLASPRCVAAAAAADAGASCNSSGEGGLAAAAGGGPDESTSSENNGVTDSADASVWSVSQLPLPAGFVAKVADFGLSKALKEGQTHHSTKTVGTVTHQPPELLRSGKLTLSGDVYSFGIMAWELLTGSVPYKGLMYGEVVERVVVSHRRPEFPPHTPAAYRALAERCWAADAAARPTFKEVLAELEALLATAPQLQAESDSVALPPPTASSSSAAPATAATTAVNTPSGGPSGAPTSSGVTPR
ncbi:hypothetical protein HXX76_014626 [Chlamydomonas incerta]|uniref:Protein kinase domain-containing protein n=1 Tax=Chlamydomonas incerta TaxID=51695 RepID=A0A835VPC5_CHLIN|nr:hypothetical protein HXX76_014626 [Chlamydomonas incerta]|eukprot:KAG2424242.1 hypothetical protein HXX76_014626 [Chlamydomonas incerta]